MTVTLQYFKYPDTPHWRHEMIRLGEDECGVWLGAATGAAFRRGDEPPVTMSRPIVQLVTPDRWWSPIFNGAGHRMHTYVDVATLPEWRSPDRVEMVDLDLDVILFRDGSILVDDEDEFEEHQITLGYPPRLVAAARAAVAQVVAALEAGRAPFDGRADSWLQMVS